MCYHVGTVSDFKSFEWIGISLVIHSVILGLRSVSHEISIGMADCKKSLCITSSIQLQYEAVLRVITSGDLACWQQSIFVTMSIVIVNPDLDSLSVFDTLCADRTIRAWHTGSVTAILRTFWWQLVRMKRHSKYLMGWQHRLFQPHLLHWLPHPHDCLCKDFLEILQELFLQTGASCLTKQTSMHTCMHFCSVKGIHGLALGLTMLCIWLWLGIREGVQYIDYFLPECTHVVPGQQQLAKLPGVCDIKKSWLAQSMLADFWA